jgi:hypothetical protein
MKRMYPDFCRNETSGRWYDRDRPRFPHCLRCPKGVVELWADLSTGATAPMVQIATGPFPHVDTRPMVFPHWRYAARPIDRVSDDLASSQLG